MPTTSGLWRNYENFPKFSHRIQSNQPLHGPIASDVIMFIHLQSCVSSQESLPVPCILCLKQQQHLVSGWLLRAERSLPLLVRSFACLLIQLAASSTLPSRLHVCSASHPESSTNRRSILLCARFNSPGVVLNRFKLRPLSPSPGHLSQGK